MHNTLYYGDNLAILRKYIADASVDLIYLDPPFNSNRSYSVLFKNEGGAASEAQVQAFDDTWHWGQPAEDTYLALVTQGSSPVANMIAAMRQFIGTNQMMAYLVMMAARLVELHRVLKPTGSLYLHCDPTASHYLKVVLDTIFGVENYRNELIWKRTSAHANVSQKFGVVHDVILFYSASESVTWNQQHTPYEPEYVDTFFDQVDESGRRYARRDLTASMQRASVGQIYTWKGITPPPSRCWAMAKDRMDELERQGRIHWPKKAGGMPRLKLYPEDLPGVPMQDIWTDIKTMHNLSAERLGYPTQKPVALLERIIAASSNEGDIVLDPFCGCGTTIAAAQKLNRRWIGIDITNLAISLQKYRLKDAFGLVAGKDYLVVGQPQDLDSAIQLSKENRHQFEWWALSLIGAQPISPTDDSGKQGKKGADKGIDGQLVFVDDSTGKGKRVIVQVKSGHVSASIVRDLRGVIEREKAAMGVLITLDPPSQPMRTEAASAGHYTSPGWNRSYPRLQILTVEGLLAGVERLDKPPTSKTFKEAPKEGQEKPKQPGLGLG
jgi:site-specific DNA-methyltransferase (adenine-specific)